MKLYVCCHLSKEYLFLTSRTINSSSLVKLPALVSINKHSFRKAVLLKGLALNKKLTFQRLTFMPNQECNHLTFKSFSIHVFSLHFYAKGVHVVRLPASRREQFKDLFSLCLVLPVFILSAPSFSVIGVYHNCIGSRPLAEWDFEVGQKLKRMSTTYTKRVYILMPAAVVPVLYFTHKLGGSMVACGEHELVVFKYVNSYILSKMRDGFLWCSVPEDEKNLKSQKLNHVLI